METANQSARCLCGAVDYTLAGEPVQVSYCHCNSCRRASGAALTVYVGWADSGIDQPTHDPSVFESSPGITRGFCGSCGTTLWYRDQQLPDQTWFLLGAFTDPSAFEPTRHAFLVDKLPWLELHDDAVRHEDFSVRRNSDL